MTSKEEKQWILVQIDQVMNMIKDMQLRLENIRKNVEFTVDMKEDISEACIEDIESLPSVQQPKSELQKIAKITDLVEGTIDHLDKDDAIDLLYQIKEVLKND